MNLEAINKWLDEEYGCSYTKLEELHDFYFEKYCDLKQENKKQKEVIDKAIKYIECHKYAIKHYEPYGTPTGLPNYETYNIKGYYKLLDILKKEK